MRAYRLCCSLGVWLLLVAAPLAWAQGQLINGNRVLTGTLNAATTTGSGNAYILTLNPAITTYVLNQCFTFRANFTNTGAATLNINNVGAAALKKYVAGVSSDLSAGDIGNGQPILTCYDGSAMQLVGAGAGGGGSGASNAAHYLTTQAEAGLSAEANLGALPSGLLKHTVSGGVSTPATAVAGTDYQAPLGFTPASAATTHTIAGTPNEIASSAGAQDLSANRTWTLSLPSLVNLAGKGLLLPSGTVPPGTCTPGQVFFDTDATVGQNLYGCTATNTWTLEAGGGSGSGGSLEIREADGTPDLTGITLLTVPSGSMTSGGTGQATLSYPTLAGANVFTATTGQEMKALILDGLTSGTMTFRAADTGGAHTIKWPAGSTDFSATGGPGQVVKQVSTGGALTVGPVAKADVGLANVDNTSDAQKNSATAILTDKQLVPRTPACTVVANAVTPNADAMDVCIVNALSAGLTLNAPTATGSNPRQSQYLEFRLTTATPQPLTWNSIYAGNAGFPLPTATTGGGVEDYFGYKMNTDTTKYVLVASTQAPLLGVTTLAESPNFLCPAPTSSQCEMTLIGPSGTLTMKNPSGTAGNGKMLLLVLLCASDQALVWENQFIASATVPLPTTCRGSTTRQTMVGVRWSSGLSKWQSIGSTE